MNKWIYRLIGLLVLALAVLIFLDFWLKPRVPDPIASELGVAVVDADGKPIAPSEHGNEAGISLLSLDGALENERAQAMQQAPQLATNDTPNANVHTPPSPELGITALESPNEPAPVLSNPDANQANAWLQAGSFGSRENADKRAAELRGKGLAIDIEKATVGGKQYYRVYVGPLARGSVDKTLQQLHGMNIDAREINR